MNSLHYTMEGQSSRAKQHQPAATNPGLLRLPEPKLEDSPHTNRLKIPVTPLLMSPGQINDKSGYLNDPLNLSDLGSDLGFSDFSILSNPNAVNEDVRAAYDIAIDRIEAYAKVLKVRTSMLSLHSFLPSFVMRWIRTWGTVWLVTCVIQC